LRIAEVSLFRLNRDHGASVARTAIITGANSGLGLECARALLRDGDWHVALAVRDPARGADAVTSLDAPERCTVLSLDLASLRSVRRFIDSYATAGLPPTHALICNAGVQVVSRSELTEDGIELTFGVNHLGHFTLVTGILGQLARPARIVVVSSDTHDPARRTAMPAPRYESAEVLAHPPGGDPPAAGRAARDIPGYPPVDGRQRYTTSKLCNVLFTYELSRRLQGDDVTVNAFNPGLMPGSGLARDYGLLQRFAWRFVLPALRVLPQVNSARTSGTRLAALAADDRYAGVSGKYFDGLKEARSSEDSYDTAKARELWETSERLARERECELRLTTRFLQPCSISGWKWVETT
jgi:NAD(P)-dependent dehydrogenase (short-subunit alcohol dehydrogenase family)